MTGQIQIQTQKPTRNAQKVETPKILNSKLVEVPAYEPKKRLPTVEQFQDVNIEVLKAPVLSPPVEGKEEPIKVGLLLPLTGSPANAELGKELLDAATMALFEIAPKRLEILPRDTHGTGEGAYLAALEAVQDGAQILLGPLFRESVQAATPVARLNNIPLIALSSDSSLAGDGIYILSFTAEQELNRAISYALKSGLKRFAILAPENDYGRTVAQTSVRQVAAGGGILSRTVFYAPDGAGADEAVKTLADFKKRKRALFQRRKELNELDTEWSKKQLNLLEGLDALGELPIDAIVFPEGGRVLRSIAPLLPYYDVDLNNIKLIGTGRWDDSTVGYEPALIGGWFAGADRIALANFRLRFENLFRRTPPRIASLAYDATAIAAVLSQRKDAPNFSLELLTNRHGFTGADGLFRFHANGLVERGLAMLEIRRNDFLTVDPAPKRF